MKKITKLSWKDSLDIHRKKNENISLEDDVIPESIKPFVEFFNTNAKLNVAVVSGHVTSSSVTIKLVGDPNYLLELMDVVGNVNYKLLSPYQDAFDSVNKWSLEISDETSDVPYHMTYPVWILKTINSESNMVRTMLLDALYEELYSTSPILKPKKIVLKSWSEVYPIYKERMDKLNLDDESIDEGMKPFIKFFQDRPELEIATIFSCEGHLKNRALHNRNNVGRPYLMLTGNPDTINMLPKALQNVDLRTLDDNCSRSMYHWRLEIRTAYAVNMDRVIYPACIIRGPMGMDEAMRDNQLNILYEELTHLFKE